jgi:hypothetical protein
MDAFTIGMSFASQSIMHALPETSWVSQGTGGEGGYGHNRREIDDET